MKTSAIELIAISLIVAIITCAALLVTSPIVPITKALVSDYHILADSAVFLFAFSTLSSLVVRIIVRVSPLEAREYGIDCFAMTSTKAFYWKLLTSVTELGGMYFLPWVPLFLRPLFFSMFGANIGKNVEIAGKLVELPLITIDDYAFIGGDTFITAHAVVHDLIVLKPIRIARKVTIGVGAILMPGVEIGENSIVAPGAVVAMDTRIPPNEYWDGSPARKVRDIKPGRA